jgi:hypothetical protein
VDDGLPGPQATGMRKSSYAKLRLALEALGAHPESRDQIVSLSNNRTESVCHRGMGLLRLTNAALV